MKLYSTDFSPYSTRVRIQIRKKQLPVEISAPDLPLRTPEFYAKYPLGKVPLLVLDDDTVISESWAIMQYLESISNDIPLQPADAFEQAKMSERCRYADLHLAPALFALFGALMTGAKVDGETQLAAIFKELGKGNRLLAESKPLGERNLDIADIAMAPVMYFTLATPKALGLTIDLSNYSNLNIWWDVVQKDADIAIGIEEMDAAFKGFMAG